MRHLIHAFHHKAKYSQLAPHTRIRDFLFAEPPIDRHFTYAQVMSDISVTPKTFVDVGCCIGTDIRRLICDGLSGTSKGQNGIDSRVKD